MDSLQLFSSVQTPVATAGLILTGRDDVSLSSYTPLVQAMQAEWEKAGDALHVYVTNDLSEADRMVSELRAMGSTSVFVGGHSMQDGGIEAQHYAKAHADELDGLLLISSFLERTHRPTIEECLARKTPIDYESNSTGTVLGCRLGCLEDGVHDCYGPNGIEFPLPTLTVAGGLDGVTRITRMAEAWYTQVELTEGGAARHPVIVVDGMNHGSLLEGAPGNQVSELDLEAETEPLTAQAQVASAFRSFFGPGKAIDAVTSAETREFFGPIVEAFAVMEGSWWFTGADEEHGGPGPNRPDVACKWSSMAHKMMMEPLPEGTTWTDSPKDEYRLVSDAPFVPPYRREEHRPELLANETEMYLSKTVTQLRYVKVTLRESQVGLNAEAIIRDEKMNLLTELPDDGIDYVSAFELTTKMNSRQLVYFMFGRDAPESLDEGSRCKTINENALEWALNTVSDEARARYEAKGIKYVMVEDQEPLIPAGPFFIWAYTEYTPRPISNTVEIAAMTAFFPLDAGDYGKGNHYCKLVSPARIVEWIMVDSLRGQ